MDEQKKPEAIIQLGKVQKIYENISTTKSGSEALLILTVIKELCE